jgi:hypothetical protein
MKPWTLAVLLCGAVAPCLMGAPTNAAAQLDEDVTEFAAPAATPARTTAPKAPDVLSVKRMVMAIEPKGVTLFTRVFNIDTAAGINELFQRYRAQDKQVKEAGKSALAKKVEAALAAPAMKRKYGVIKLASAHCDMLGPQRMPIMSKGLLINYATTGVVARVLANAERAYTKTTTLLLMQQFFNWGGAPARIYLIADDELWATTLAARAMPGVLQTVVSEPANRELFVYLGPVVLEFVDQAVAAGVSMLVANEYAKAITGKPGAAMPLFFTSGLAGTVGGLDAVLTRNGAAQVAQFVVGGRTYSVKRVRPGTRAPLAEKKLMPLEALVTVKEFPARAEENYYILRQSDAMIAALTSNAPLATIALARALAGGNEFKKEVGLSYMEMQRDVLGQAVVNPKAKTEAAQKGQYPDFARMDAYLKTVFRQLTQEYRTEQLKKKPAAPAKAATPAAKKPS